MIGGRRFCALRKRLFSTTAAQNASTEEAAKAIERYENLRKTVPVQLSSYIGGASVNPSSSAAENQTFDLKMPPGALKFQRWWKPPPTM